MCLYLSEACLFYIAYFYPNVPKRCVLLNAPQHRPYPVHSATTQDKTRETSALLDRIPDIDWKASWVT
ncbi:hypothetical protein J4Q44_G00321260 [Coregonus suidteri]|uniref:Uncharacterized protein n=1 Tax=Coregonus suidteri TaxID=861788 RepID=A0AAN8QI16_9TELE